MDNCDQVPLSFAQERFWVAEMLGGSVPVFNVQWCWGLSGTVIRPALERAVQELCQRHEILRTRLRVLGDSVFQAVVREPSLEMTYDDLEDQLEAKATLARILAAAAARQFDLRTEIPIRCGLVRLGPEENVFWMTLHHIAMDAWSQDVVARDVAALYNSNVREATSRLQPLKAQYRDYALEDRVFDASRSRRLSRLAERLRNATPFPYLWSPPSPDERCPEAEVVDLHLSSDVVEDFRRVAREQRATLFMAFLAAFKLFVRQRTGQVDLTIGLPVANRLLPKWEPLVGCFMNIVPVRTVMESGSTFAEGLKQVRRSVSEALSCQDIPFLRLIEELNPPRDGLRQPLVEVSAGWSGGLRGRAVFDGLATTPIKSQRPFARFDMFLEFQEEGSRVSGAIEYRRGIATHAHMSDMAAEFSRFLRDCSARPSSLPTVARVIRLIDGGITPGTHSTQDGIKPREIGQDHADLLFEPCREKLAEIWSRLFRRTVGYDENFFELGGNSMLAMRAVVEMRESIGVELQIRALFLHQTIDGLARYIVFRPNGALNFEKSDVSATTSAENMVISIAQEYLLARSTLVEDQSVYNVILAFRIRGPLSVNAFRDAIDHILASNEVFNFRFDGRPAVPLSDTSLRASLRLAVSDTRGGTIDCETLLLRRAAAVPLEMRDGPLARAELVRLEEEHHIFAATFHHSIMDGRSIEIICRQLESAYCDLLEGRRPTFHSKSTTYSQFASWQRNLAKSEEIRDLLDERAAQLQDCLPALSDMVRNRFRLGRDHSSIRLEYVFESHVREWVQTAARTYRSTPYLILLTLVKMAFLAVTGRADIVVRTNVLNRPRSEFVDTVGFFINSIVVRSCLSGGAFLQELSIVRASYQSSLTYDIVPFDLLSKVLSDRYDVDPLLWQTVFNLQSDFVCVPELKGLQVSPMSYKRKKSAACLFIQAFLTEEELRVWFDIQTEVLEEPIVRKLAEAFCYSLNLEASRIPV